MVGHSISISSSRSQTEAERRLTRRVSAGHREMRRLRCLFSTSLFMVAVVNGALYEWLSWGDGAEVALFGNMHHTIGAFDSHNHLLDFLRCAVFLIRLVCLSLVPLADDVRYTRMILATDAALLLFPFWAYRRRLWCHSEAVQPTCPKPSCTLGLALYLGLRVADLVFIAGTTAISCFKARDAAKIQAAMWTLVQAWIITNAIVVRGLYAIGIAIECNIIASDWWWVLGGLVALSVVMRPDLRRRLQARCLSAFEGRSATASAAGIAALVGKCSAKEALASARTRFRCICVSELEESDFAANTPDPDVYAKSVLTKLGDCDAFLSHSWHDDAEAKWNALQQWRLEFIARERREPRIWFDKCCIDQRNIQKDLPCLPLFLCGCSKLVMFCGPSYLSRLWCVVELFAYVHMGGRVESIEIVPVVRRSHPEQDVESIRASFHAFDAQTCKCHNAQDKETMLMAIHTAFGSMDRFNETVRRIIDQIQHPSEGCDSDWLTSTSNSSEEGDSESESESEEGGAAGSPRDEPV